MSMLITDSVINNMINGTIIIGTMIIDTTSSINTVDN